MRWIIIGTGNVAWHFAALWAQTGEVCLGVASREIAQAEAFLQTLPAPHALRAYALDALPTEAEAFLVAVADDAIAPLAERLATLPPRLIVHTSGTKPLDSLQVLAGKGWSTGIFYPLQTITRQKPLDWSQIPLLLEAEKPEIQGVLAHIAHKISQKVVFVHSEQRKWLHLAAVMTANFLHHLCSIGEELLAQQDLSFQLLQPLLQETLAKALQPHAALTQTGPARRGDTQTIQNHLALLEAFPAWKNVYEALTASLWEMYHAK